MEWRESKTVEHFKFKKSRSTCVLSRQVDGSPAVSYQRSIISFHKKLDNRIGKLLAFSGISYPGIPDWSHQEYVPRALTLDL